MDVLPTGTVSLLFTDIEGSTALLSRLGSLYADALDGQRQVLRQAWAGNGGAELGTEGDSFFVVFATAAEAVTAAEEAQRGLASFSWPNNEQVSVRMGIHTGAPAVHDGGYVGMDVHRAARIAGAAHGGQVVVSASTAELVGGVLPQGVSLRDLGRHQLKDIEVTEHLFQLSIDGLRTEFPPLKALGAGSSLPRPATGLVGREGELAELTALLLNPGVRLLTLTGPGGSGKTRLAIAMAHRLTESLPDGVYFVSLAAVASADDMWTSIGEVLDVPPQGRTIPALFTHLMHNGNAALVLDNLEQLSGADSVVSQLLAAAPRIVVIATSRRPLHVSGEYEHPVPPLELPDQEGLADVQGCGAVQLFVQRARMVRPGFAVNDDNAADVVEVCRRLDGLPLAIELAAARSKLLSPAALVARLGSILELRDTAVDRPTRQQTLRDTIDWSYRLLLPAQRAFFRRLGVVAGSGDLDCLAALTAGAADQEDVLDNVAGLVDASLATIYEDDRGEPRVGLLETVRAFAQDQLHQAGELDDVRSRHAHHYLEVAAAVRKLLESCREDRVLAARRTFELDGDNFRDALSWALSADDHPQAPPTDRLVVGLRICAELSQFWADRGSLAEGQRWLERAITLAGDDENPDLADCLKGLGGLWQRRGNLDRARSVAEQSVAMWRRLGDRRGLLEALLKSGVPAYLMGDLRVHREILDEVLTLARSLGDNHHVARALSDLGILEAVEHNFERSLELHRQAIRISIDEGDEVNPLKDRHSSACTLREMGRLQDAHSELRDLIPSILRLADPEWLVLLTEDYAAVLAELGDHERAARLMGAAEGRRDRIKTPRSVIQQAEIEEPIGKVRTALSTEAWNRHYHLGHDMTIEDALREAYSVTP